MSTGDEWKRVEHLEQEMSKVQRQDQVWQQDQVQQQDQVWQQDQVQRRDRVRQQDWVQQQDQEQLQDQMRQQDQARRHWWRQDQQQRPRYQGVTDPEAGVDEDVALLTGGGVSSQEEHKWHQSWPLRSQELVSGFVAAGQMDWDHPEVG